MNNEEGNPKQQAIGSFVAQAHGSHAHASVTINQGINALPSVSVPLLPANFVERPQALDALRDQLLGQDGAQSRVIGLTAMQGMGGIGKTVLAQALCEDERVKRAFPDGIFWQTIGKESDVDNDLRIRAVVNALHGGVGHDVGRKEIPAAVDEYRSVTSTKAALLVIDDVWRVSDIAPWLTKSLRSRVLFTTRDASIAGLVEAEQYWAELLSLEQSREMFVRWAGAEKDGLPPEADAIMAECRQLPLALSMVGAMLQGKDADFWQATLDQLLNADLEKIKAQFPNYPYPNLFVAIKVSVDALEPLERERYCALAVLLEEMEAARTIQQTLWGTNVGEAAETAERFIDLSLAQRGVDGKSIRLHDLQLDYIRAQHHDKGSLELIHEAVRLSAHVIRKDPRQFAGQIAGRLMLAEERPQVGRFAASLIRHAPCPWLRPLNAVLDRPGGALKQTFQGHSAGIVAVALSGDGRRMVSALRDKTLTVWDLDNRRELRSLRGYSEEVNGLALSRDGRRAVFTSDENTLKVWDLNTWEVRTVEGFYCEGVVVNADGRLAVSAHGQWVEVWDLDNGRRIHMLTGHSDKVNGVAVSNDGQLVVSASSDKTLVVWDINTGEAVRTLLGHSGSVLAVVVSGDGQLAVSASNDNTLMVWDMKRGQAMRTLRGHSKSVYAVALSKDGRRAISASYDMLKVWEVDSGRELRSLLGHYSVLGLAMSQDGRRAVSFSSESLKIWDLDSGDEMRTHWSHSDVVRGVAASAVGRIAVSASEDKTLKAWDLDTGERLATFKGHTDGVMGVAMSWDGQIIVSASRDTTLKIWDVNRQIFEIVPTLEGHSDRVMGVAVSRDGQYAVSASRDRTLKLWDLLKKVELRTFEGHDGTVNGVALNEDRRLAVSASEDQTLRVWNLDHGGQLRNLNDQFKKFVAVAVSRDGRWAVSASTENTLKVWDLRVGEEVRVFDGHSGQVIGVALSEDGRLAVSASEDQTLKVWDMDNGVNIATFTCDGMACCCTFAGENRIVAGDSGGRVYFLDLVLEPQMGSTLHWKSEKEQSASSSKGLKQRGLELIFGRVPAFARWDAQLRRVTAFLRRSLEALRARLGLPPWMN